MLVACGSSPHAVPDAAADATPDVTGAVTVYAPYRTAGIITPGARVLCYDAAGTLVDRQMTDADGVATAQVPTGGFVVAVSPAGSSSHEYYEWIDVAIGDHLATEAARVPEQTSRDVTVTLGRDGSDATSYLITAPSFVAESDAPAPTGPITLAGTVWSDAPAAEDLVAEAARPDHSRFAIAHAVPLTSPAIDLQDDQPMPDGTVTYIGGNDPAGYAAARTDPNVFDFIRYSEIVPATPGVYRYAHNKLSSGGSSSRCIAARSASRRAIISSYARSSRSHCAMRTRFNRRRRRHASASRIAHSTHTASPSRPIGASR